MLRNLWRKVWSRVVCGQAAHDWHPMEEFRFDPEGPELNALGRGRTIRYYGCWSCGLRSDGGWND